MSQNISLSCSCVWVLFLPSWIDPIKHSNLCDWAVWPIPQNSRLQSHLGWTLVGWFANCLFVFWTTIVQFLLRWALRTRCKIWVDHCRRQEHYCIWRHRGWWRRSVACRETPQLRVSWEWFLLPYSYPFCVFLLRFSHRFKEALLYSDKAVNQVR